MENPVLAEWAEHIERLQWAAIILDADWNLSWVSEELRMFLRAEGADDVEDLGFGSHIIEAFVKPHWIETVHPQSQVQMFSDLAPFLAYDFKKRGRSLDGVLPEQFIPLIEGVEPKEPPQLWATRFEYLNKEIDEELPDYSVNCCFFRLVDESGEDLGCVVIFFMAVRPNLLTLLARGDEPMYERMAKLVEPGHRRGAILFCDLQGSGPLSRQLPSARYFRLVRRLWTGIDKAVAEHTGVIGKHAGDGASAFFLVDDCGGDSQAAAAAMKAARAIHEVGESVFREVMDSPCLMRVGIHWGGSLFMGQLVPGGRLDVTALGDEVNEAARVQECAPAGETFATKPLLEHLSPDDAAELGLDLEKITYKILGELTDVSEKAIRDAGALAVATV